MNREFPRSRRGATPGRTRNPALSCPRTRPACASGCSAAPSIRRTRRIAALACLAMKRLGLDRVWWLVTPGNPLKDTDGLAPLAARVVGGAARSRIIRASTSPVSRRRSARPTLTRRCRYLVRRCPQVHFVWIMGADNLRSFHRWQRWRGIARLVPIAVVDRLGPSLYASAGVAGQALAHARVPETAAKTLPERTPAGLDLSAWPQVAAVFDGAAGGARTATDS